MKFFVLLAAIASFTLANPATLLHPLHVSQGLIDDPRYILYKRPDGYIEVEDLYNSTAEKILGVTHDDVLFYFFNKNNLEEGVLIKPDQLNDIVNLTGFNIDKPSLIIVHGWRNNIESPVNDLIKDEILRTKDINVIVVDWGSIAKKFYFTAQKAVVLVGNFIGDFLLSLDEAVGHRLTDVTMVGHSLGAHISGNAGNRSKGLIDIIIGLDPAGPLFHKENINNRLDPTDAKFVHVIHTSKMLGFDSKLGHVDFYPNGGEKQPGCFFDITGICAHSRAYQYYSESLNNNSFTGRLCNNWDDYEDDKCEQSAISHMGSFPINTNVYGDYYLTTNKKPPYAQ